MAGLVTFTALVVGLGAAGGPATAEVSARTRNLRLPGVAVTVHEKSGDRLVVTSYWLAGRTAMAYLRTSSSTFTEMAEYWRVAVSPDGRRALGAGSYLDDNGCETFDVIDRRSGTVLHLSVPSVCKPLNGGYFAWSPDGTKAVQLVFKKKRTGFLTIDALKGTTRYVPLPNSYEDSYFTWTPDGVHVLAYDDARLRFLRPDGKNVKTYSGLGVLAEGAHAFSPSGTRFVTYCPSSSGMCLWHTRTGKSAGRVGFPADDMYGWWDEKHLVVRKETGKNFQAVVIDLSGKVTRVLADIAASAVKKYSVDLDFTHR
ncbi:hypothetical protein MPTA5024_35695 [Microbispora sp. ATCC PTA-5024]|nr:hypothetical protein MPTA5024_35695 [Microbispora sp. ATCC PTA-5024]